MAWVDTVAEEYVERAAALDPVLATQAGIAGYDHALPDLSADGFAERARLDRLTLAALDAAEVRGPGEQVAREAMRERFLRYRRFSDMSNIFSAPHQPRGEMIRLIVAGVVIAVLGVATALIIAIDRFA